MILKINDYGYPTSTALKCKINGKEYYRENQKFSWRFFPHHIAREFEPFSFPVEKAENTYRIFVMGGSAAQGIPEPSYSFDRYLKVMLQQKYPQVNFEVINVAIGAINSHVVYEIAKDCSKYDPDMFVIYLGNNEVVGPYGAGTVFSSFQSKLSMIRLSNWFKATKLGQFLTNTLKSKKEKEIQSWQGMAMFLEKQIRADSEVLASIYQNFRINLEDIGKLAERHHIEIIFSNVGANYKDCPPFASLHRIDLSEIDKKKWEQLYEQAIKKEGQGNYSRAIEDYLACNKIDTEYADLHFRMARCYLELNDRNNAGISFINALEYDTLRFRSDKAVNAIIKNVVTESSSKTVHFVDTRQAFENDTLHGIPGNELFYEHVHMNFHGNYILAKNIFNKIEELLPQNIKNAKVTEKTLTEKDCRKYLAHTTLDEYTIMNRLIDLFLSKPPFTNWLYYGEILEKRKNEERNLHLSLSERQLREDLEAYRWAISKSASDQVLRLKYAEYLMLRYNDLKAAEEQFHFLEQNYPPYYFTLLRLSQIAVNQGDPNSAIEYGLRTIELNPTYSLSYYNMAKIYQQIGKFNAAIHYFNKTLEYQPDNLNVYNLLGNIYYKHKDYDKAIEYYEKGLEYDPENARLNCNLGVVLAEINKKKEAIEHLEKALKTNPNMPDAQAMLDFIKNH